MVRFEPSPPVVVFLHFLGGSARSWSAVIGKLVGRISCLALDLPGFGGAADVPGYTVEEMADDVGARVRRLGFGRWMIAGHSMGAKVATVVARHAEDGESGLEGLQGLVLVAGSPPSPEPMADAQREAMLGWFTGAKAAWPDQARGYIEAQVAAPLDPAVRASAVADVLRMLPDAWAAWLHDGSREDWSDRVGLLRTPTAILYGAEDAALGEDAQIRLMAPHFASHSLLRLDGAAHLLPLERPDAVARSIADHVGWYRNAR